jgi:DNA-binding transcriptional ArsR family regulator
MGKADAVEAKEALDHPVRREILRVLGSGERSWTVAELGAELPDLCLSQLTYHLQVLRRAAAAASEAAGASASPPLTMFRVPRPAQTIRLLPRSRTDAGQDR